jgi:hypothetical protein
MAKSTIFVVRYTRDGKQRESHAQAISGADTVEKMKAHLTKFKVYGATATIDSVELIADHKTAAEAAQNRPALPLAIEKQLNSDDAKAPA